MDTRLCGCGCGQKTKTSDKTQKKFGWIKGEPRMFLRGHNLKIANNKRENNHRWKGGYRINNDGYAMILMPDHPRSQSNGYVLEHIIVIEKVLGKPMPPKAKTHHVNEIRHDNRNENIVICEDDAYHFLLHQRKRALEVCGNAKWRKCVFCKQYDDLKNMFIGSQGTAYHRSCSNKYAIERRRKKDLLNPKDKHYRRGYKNGNSKLKEGEVWLIKRLLKSGLISQPYIAKMFKTPKPTINHIKTGRTWGHLT